MHYYQSRIPRMSATVAQNCRNKQPGSTRRIAPRSALAARHGAGKPAETDDLPVAGGLSGVGIGMA